LGLAAGGALGNIFDRLRFRAGVVDSIDVGIATHRFWIFNVADAGITVGALLLAFTVLREESNASGSRPAV
jgi:signal peptidase II